MNQLPNARPTGLTIIAWLWIVGGGLMILSALMAGFAYSVMPAAPQLSGAVPPNAPAGFNLISIMFEYIILILVIQCIIASIAITAGIYLLRLRSWARTVIEILSWLALVYFILFGIYWSYAWMSITSEMPPGPMTHGNTNNIQLMGLVMGSIFTVIFAIPSIIIIRYLRSVVVREVVS